MILPVQRKIISIPNLSASVSLVPSCSISTSEAIPALRELRIISESREPIVAIETSGIELTHSAREAAA